MSDVTRILSQIESGDPSAAEQLLPLVHDERRKLAASRMSHENHGQTLQATALVHDVYFPHRKPTKMCSNDLVTIHRSENNITICFLESRLNTVGPENEPWRTIELALQTYSPEKVMLDFAKVNLLSSVILGKIIGLKRKTKAEIILVNLSELLSEIFRVTGLNRLFVIEQ